MKKYNRLVAALAMCFSLILLGSCSPDSKLVGTWQGDGSLDMMGMEAPYEFVTKWAFDESGQAIATVEEAEIAFKYSATDDTITLNDGEMSWGVRYSVKGKTLSIETGDGAAVFTKMN